MVELLSKFRTKSEAQIYFGFPINGRGSKLMDEILESNGENKDYYKSTEIYKRNPSFCRNCKEEIDYKYRVNSYCSKSCSASLTNLGKIKSKETKDKISKSLLGRKITCIRYPKKLRNNKLYRIKKNLLPRNRTCNKCSSLYTYKSRGCRSKYCSLECSNLGRSENISKSIKLAIKEGRHKGWISRNVLSYPEKFFIEVLKNNNIFHLCETNYPKGGYFLDFYFKNKKLDLEIDGKQHEYDDRRYSDFHRDNYLTSENIIVHRIKWKSINKNEGRIYMEKEINKFLVLYNSI